VVGRLNFLEMIEDSKQKEWVRKQLASLPRSFEVVLKDKAGSRLIVQAALDQVPVSGEIILSLADVTAQRKLEEELKGSEVPKLTEEVTRIEQELSRLDGRLRDGEAAIAQTKMEQGFIESRVADGRKRIEEIDQNIASLRDKITQNEAQIKAHQERMAELGRREQEIDVELVGLKRQRDDMSEALSKADHDL
jgi:chromosome segregation protein